MLERDKPGQPAGRPKATRPRPGIARPAPATSGGRLQDPKTIPRIQSGASADARSISLLEQLRRDAAPEPAAPEPSEPEQDHAEHSAPAIEADVAQDASQADSGPTDLTPDMRIDVPQDPSPQDHAAATEQTAAADMPEDDMPKEGVVEDITEDVAEVDDQRDLAEPDAIAIAPALETLRMTQDGVIDMTDKPALPIAAQATSSLPAESPHTPRASWETLTQIPFRDGGNDPLRAQMHLAGSDDRVIRVIDDLRTQLLRSMETESWNRIAITSPTSGCGSTFTAVNLALSISRIPDFRAILMDLNQRNPAVARTLNLDGDSHIQHFLSGDVPTDEHLLKYSDTLALGLNTERSPNPSELLHSRRTAAVLDGMIRDLRPDIVLYDLPAMLDYDDMSAFLPQVDGVLLVADATRTLGKQIEECERRLAGKTPLLGVILNRARRASQSQQAA